jgi:His/Glu/Gln/Arg/opine family amino acid ABC transporter permease subunit
VLTLQSYGRILIYLASGAGATLLLTAAALALSTVAGFGLALLQLHRWRLLRYAAATYTFVVRGIPLLVLLVAVYFGLPYAGIDVPAWWGGATVIGLYFAAYLGEVFRAALASVPRTQWDAGRSLGLSGLSLLSIAVLPHAARLAAAPYVNVALGLVKNTSLASTIGVWELAAAGREVVDRTSAAFALYLTVAAFYFIMCFALSRLSRWLERRIDHDA